MPGLTFRTQALEKLSSPEQLDQLIRVTPARGWLALAGLACLLLPLLGWALWGRLETRTSAQGVLLPSGGLCLITAQQAGQVSELRVWLGQHIQTGQVVARLQPAGSNSSPQELVSRCDGIVVDIAGLAGDPLQSGQWLVTVEPAGQPLEVVAYLPLDEARSLSHGLPARISPAGFQAEVTGYLLGEVRWVGQYPIDAQTLARQVGSQALAQALWPQGALVEVHITLAEHPGEYRWSLNRQPGQLLASGTPCAVSILLERRAPIELIFPRLSQ